MNFLFRKLLQAAVVAGIMLNLASAYDLSKKTSTSIFKGFGKYPYQQKFNPFRNEVDLILYGCLDENSNVKVVKSADDYANLVPVQITMNFPDNGIKMKRTYHGYYETATTKIADSTLRFFGMLPGEDYKKDFKNDFLMAEYEAGMPIKMVFANLDQFKAVKKYLQEKFEGPEGVSSDQVSKKPLLLIEIESGEAIEQVDLVFLNNYFEVADTSDVAVQAFFDKVGENIANIGYMRELAQVGKSFGDMIMELIDKDFDSGDVSKLTIKTVKWLTFVALTAAAIKVVDKLADAYITKPIAVRLGVEPVKEVSKPALPAPSN